MCTFLFWMVHCGIREDGLILNTDMAQMVEIFLVEDIRRQCTKCKQQNPVTFINDVVAINYLWFPPKWYSLHSMFVVMYVKITKMEDIIYNGLFCRFSFLIYRNDKKYTRQTGNVEAYNYCTLKMRWFYDLEANWFYCAWTYNINRQTGSSESLFVKMSSDNNHFPCSRWVSLTMHDKRKTTVWRKQNNGVSEKEWVLFLTYLSR